MKKTKTIGVAYCYPSSEHGGKDGGWFVFTSDGHMGPCNKESSLFVSAAAAETAIVHVEARIGKCITNRYCAVRGEFEFGTGTKKVSK